MSLRLLPAFVLRVLLLASTVTTFSLSVFGQAPAIEPCPATPNATKPLLGNTAPAKVDTKANQTAIDSSIPDDPDVEKMLVPFAAKVRALSAVIGKLDGELKKSGVGAGTLGNFVSDGIRAQAGRKLGKPVTLSIMNAGGMRKNEISPGDLRASDIFELLPFENTLLTIDFSGTQLLKLLQIGTRDAQSGAKIQFKYNEQDRTEFIAAKLIVDGREEEIDPNKVYTVVTIDYLFNLRSGPYAILQEGTNRKPLDGTLRDIMMEYVKSETAAGRSIKPRTDDRFVQIGPGPKKPETPND